MKLKFKTQAYQSNAVAAVLDCFKGQPPSNNIAYAKNPFDRLALENGFRNAELQLPDNAILENIKIVQQRQNLPASKQLASSIECRINLDIDMETGTGKTYCYIKTIFELNKQYGWSKFIIMVPTPFAKGSINLSKSPPSIFTNITPKRRVSLFIIPKSCMN